jgi:chromosomal replication initiator protein
MGHFTMMRQVTAGRDDWSQANPSSTLPTIKGEKPVMISSDTSEGQRELWNRVRARLKAGVGEDVFASWFARLELEEIVEDVVHLSAPTRFLCSWVQSNYADRILEAFRQDAEEVSRIQVTARMQRRCLAFR